MSTAIEAAASRAEQVRPTTERLFSLDLFRGTTIAAMIVVNNQNGESYWPLQHAAWNGWTPTDLVFPFFLIIVGVSLVFSFESRLERGSSRRALVIHTARRSIILFAIGLGLNGLAGLPTGTWRIPGVLQRIAIVYFFAALVLLFSSLRTSVVLIVMLLVGYWVLMRYAPVPGYGLPGRDIPLLHPDANLAAYLDRKLMLGHLWEKTRDPEGILSTLPAIATGLCGVLTGQWLRLQRASKSKVIAMVAVGLSGVIAGQLWSIWFPINKKLWTSSYVLFTAGCALICLAICCWISDVKMHRGPWAKPLVILGTNAIVAYVISELLGGWLSWKGITFLRSPASLDSPQVASLLHSIVVLGLCFVPVWWLYQRRIFVKV
jgi:predicted acyltransferase